MELEKGIREKLAMFCHVNVKNILSVHDVSNIYHVPDMLQKQGLPNVICRWVFVLDLSLLSHPPLDLSLLSLSLIVYCSYINLIIELFSFVIF